ncbi:YoaK family protein [Oceanicola sp. S124]|uniref:YoaK family protein n=1 Tax=Oceanicola sp. S124 TaxID=1042378 RepID=UPI0002557AA5|nr:YoaK family protein [Oceanicola sp. S124]
MLVHVGDERNGTIDRHLAAALSTIAGALNAVGFLIASSFTANMTGNLSAFADEVARGSWRSSLGFLFLLALFIAGATLAAAFIVFGEQRGLRSVYAAAIATEGVIVAALGPLLSFHDDGSKAWLVGCLSLVMGLQNAVTTLISRSRVRTTHVSGMATDIGIGLAAILTPGRSRTAALPNLGLHVLTLSAFALGGIAGALLHAAIGPWLFTLAGGCLLAIALPEMLRARHLPRPD